MNVTRYNDEQRKQRKVRGKSTTRFVKQESGPGSVGEEDCSFMVLLRQRHVERIRSHRNEAGTIVCCLKYCDSEREFGGTENIQGA